MTVTQTGGQTESVYISALLISYVNIGGPLVEDCIIRGNLEGKYSNFLSVFQTFQGFDFVV